LRKIASILLICVFLCNAFGYKLYYQILENKSIAAFEKRIEAKQYLSSQLLELKIPLAIPYLTNSDFSDCWGETNWKGKHYRYVKRKISNDTLILLCLPNPTKDRIENQLSALNKALAEMNSDTKSKPSNSQKTALFQLLKSDYLPTESWEVKNISGVEEQVFCLYHPCRLKTTIQDAAYVPPKSFHTV